MSLKNRENFEEALFTKLPKECVKIDEPMKEHTSFRIGGPCDYYISPNTIEELKHVLITCKEQDVPLFVLGNGSNLLVTDKGIRGVVLEVFKNFNDIKIEKNVVTAGAGILLSVLAKKAANEHLAGLEFASGIPGTLGGAVFMNAGAYGGEMKQVVRQVTAISKEGELRVFEADELDFGYRHSALQQGHYIALEAVMELEKGHIKDIKELMMDLNMRRKDKQPLELPSAGSTFKRPEGYYAGKLIMDAGLRGYSIGDASVSEKHCGFVVNTGDATFEQVYALIQHIQKTVMDQFGVKLEREVKIIGER